MNAGLPAEPPAIDLVVVVLALLGAGAFLVALVSAIDAWMKSWNHPPFRALGLRKWGMGIFALKYMPAAAMPYVKRYFVAFGVFMASVLGIIAYSWFAPSGTGT